MDEGNSELADSLHKRKQATYRGDLKKPIDVPFPALEFEGRVTDENKSELDSARYRQEKAYSDAIRAEFVRKMRLLAEHYGINSNQEIRDVWAQLSFHLACQHVPGFQFRNRGKKRGPKTIWTYEKLEDLRITIEKVKKHIGGSDRAACSFIVSNPEYADKWGKKDLSPADKRKWVESLESRLHDAKQQRRRHNSLLAALLSR